MNNLTIKQINIRGQAVPVVDSREVAEMLSKEHSDILKEIEGRKDNKNVGIIPTLEKGNFHLSNYFIPSTYKSGTREYKCYLVTKMGCELLGNKQQGEKGILFTAKYVEAFNKMEEHIKGQALNTSELSLELQMFNQMFKAIANNELEQKRLKAAVEETKAEVEEAKEEIQGIRDIVAINSTNWRKDTSTLISKMALKLGGYEHINLLREESYKILEERGRARLAVKLTNKRRRMADEGVCKSRRDKLNKLDVIGEDSRLLEIYLAVVKDMAIKYGVKVN